MLDIMYRIAIGFLNVAIVFSVIAVIFGAIYGTITLVTTVSPLFAIPILIPVCLAAFYAMGEDTLW